MWFRRADRRLRLAVTVADGAIQGFGSAGFEQEEARADSRPSLHVGVCQFHRVDGAGNRADRQFPLTAFFDRFLRLVRKSFGFGTGVLVLRATAREFERLASLLDMQASRSAQEVARAQAEGQPLAAERHRLAQAKGKRPCPCVSQGWVDAFPATSGAER